MVLLMGLLCPSVQAQSEAAGQGNLSPPPVAPNPTDLKCIRLEELTGGPAPAVSMPCASPGGTYFFADALYWTVREGSADNWAQVITPQDDWGAWIGTTTIVDAPFAWSTGLRVGLGRVQCSDGWDVRAYYTYYNTQATSHAAGEVYSAFMGNFYVDNMDGPKYGPQYRSADIQWNFNFHTIDLELRRSFDVASNFTVCPFVGLKTAIINQALHSQWRQPINASGKVYLFHAATEDLSQNFWGIGPSLGVTLEMPLYDRPQYSLKLFGTPSGALMYGHWTFDEFYQNDGPTSLLDPFPTQVTIGMSPIDSVATMVSGVLGVEWTQRFARATSTVRLGYEAQVWLNQMQFYSYNMGRLNNLMSLHGGTLEWSINF
jgi:hypothetical protein